MREVYVAGAAMTRFGKFPERDAPVAGGGGRARRARRRRASPPPTSAWSFFANAVAGLVTGQEMIRGQVALRPPGDRACRSSTSRTPAPRRPAPSPRLAWRSPPGPSTSRSAVGAEKLTHEDKTRGRDGRDRHRDRRRAAGRRWRLEARHGRGRRAAATARSSWTSTPAMARALHGRSGATARGLRRRSRSRTSTTAALNPRAQYGGELTVEEVLASRGSSPPLTLLMCSPIGDGAAALVALLERGRGAPAAPAVRVRASVAPSRAATATPATPGAVERAAARGLRAGRHRPRATSTASRSTTPPPRPS